MADSPTDESIIQDAISKYPECSFGIVHNGMAFPFTVTRVVYLWRNVDCYLASDPPRHIIEGYPA